LEEAPEAHPRIECPVERAAGAARIRSEEVGTRSCVEWVSLLRAKQTSSNGDERRGRIPEKKESASFLLRKFVQLDSKKASKKISNSRFPASLLRDVFCIDTNGENADADEDNQSEDNQSDDEKSRSDGEPKRGPVRHARGPVDGLTRLVRDAIAAQERFHETNVETHRRNSE